MNVRSMLALAVSLAASSALADDAQPSPTGIQLLEAYPQRVADRPVAIGQGIAQLELQGSYLFGQVAGLAEAPSLRYGITSKWEAILLGLRYNVSEDSQYIPGLAIRAQLHDLAYEPPLPGNQYPYPALRPGLFIDLRDRLPAHVTLNGTVGYVVSWQTGNFLNGQTIPLGQRESAQLVPMSLRADYSPFDKLSFQGAVGFIYDVGVDPLLPSQDDAYARVDAVFTPNNRLDLRLFGIVNQFDSPIGTVPQLGIGVTYRL
ncbi:MAG: hypothetical protein ACYCWW_12645 [Deltaproteobacteria bacterium]